MRGPGLLVLAGLTYAPLRATPALSLPSYTQCAAVNSQREPITLAPQEAHPVRKRRSSAANQGGAVFN